MGCAAASSRASPTREAGTSAGHTPHHAHSHHTFTPLAVRRPRCPTVTRWTPCAATNRPHPTSRSNTPPSLPYAKPQPLTRGDVTLRQPLLSTSLHQPAVRNRRSCHLPSPPHGRLTLFLPPVRPADCPEHHAPPCRTHLFTPPSESPLAESAICQAAARTRGHASPPVSPQYQFAPADCSERGSCSLLSLQPCPWGC